MKRLLIAVCILGSGALVFSGVRIATQRNASELHGVQQMLQQQGVLISGFRERHSVLESEVREFARRLKAQETIAIGLSNGDRALVGSMSLSEKQSETLLAELGFDWNSTGEFLVVSKQTLGAINAEGMEGFNVSETACQLLAINPEERSRLEAVTHQLAAEYQSWLQSRIKRQDSSGDVLAKYSFENDPEFSQSQSNRFASTVLSGLGRERGELLLNYSRNWMVNMGMYDAGVPEKETTMVIRRQGNQDYLMVDVNQSGSRMSCGLTRWQPVPEVFRSLFPGGWEELARKEGFQLPDSFYGK